MDNYALRIINVSKMYKLYDKPLDRLKESLSPFKKVYHKEFYALNNINFEIFKGESVGIIGTNGSGKSTLLKIITGVLSQSQGEIETNGKISALLELGAGFNPEYTGIENIYLNGTIMGYSAKEIEEKLEDILNFADIGEFINQPVKSYSSGMFVRLAFATQIYSDPDILIVDEALSVGDVRFQQKCYRAMESIMKNKTVVLVTHDPGAILRFCKRVIWIEKGAVMYDGEAETALKKYQSHLLNMMDKHDEALVELKEAEIDNNSLNLTKLDDKVEKAGKGGADIIACGLFDINGVPAHFVTPGEKYTFAMRVQIKEIKANLIAGVSVKNRLGEDVFGINSLLLNKSADTGEFDNEYRFEFEMPMLNAGQYTISPAIARGTFAEHIQLCWIHDAIIFEVSQRDFQLPGILYIGDNFEFKIYNGI